MGCITGIISEFIWSIIIAIPVTVLFVLFGNDDVLGVFRTTTGVIFTVGIFIDFCIWANKINLDY